MSSSNTKNICRTCLSTDGEFVSLFSDSPENANLTEKVAYVTGVKINKEKGLPCMICKKCIYLVDSYYSFKKQIESVSKKVKNSESETQNAQVEKDLNLKEEIPDEDVNDSDYEVQYISDEVKREVEIAFRRKEAIKTVNHLTNTILKNFQDMFLRIDDLMNIKSEPRYEERRTVDTQTSCDSGIFNQSLSCCPKEISQTEEDIQELPPNYGATKSGNLETEDSDIIEDNIVQDKSLDMEENLLQLEVEKHVSDHSDVISAQPTSLNSDSQEKEKTSHTELIIDNKKADEAFHLDETTEEKIPDTKKADEVFHLDETTEEKIPHAQKADEAFHLDETTEEKIPHTQKADEVFHLDKTTEEKIPEPISPDCDPKENEDKLENTETMVVEPCVDISDIEMANPDCQRQEIVENVDTPECSNVPNEGLSNFEKLDDDEDKLETEPAFYDNEEECADMENPLRIQEEPMENETIESNENNTTQTENVINSENRVSSPITPYTDTANTTEEPVNTTEADKSILEKSLEPKAQIDEEAPEKIINDPSYDKENVKPAEIGKEKNKNDVIVISSDSSSEKKNSNISTIELARQVKKKLFTSRMMAKRNLMANKKGTEVTKNQTRTGVKKPIQPKRYFQCTTCNINLYSVSEVLHHHNQFHTAPQFALHCHMCDLPFPNKLVLHSHFEKHVESHLYRCFFCTSEFVLKQNLRSHMNAHLRPKVVHPQVKRMRMSEVKQNGGVSPIRNDPKDTGTVLTESKINNQINNEG